MSDSHLFEYSIVRYVPSVERGEAVNIGLAMMCKRRRWMRLEFHLDHERLEALRAPHTPAEIEAQLEGMKLVAAGNPSDGRLAAMEPEERFRWLTAVRSASIQTSRPHPGTCADLDATFKRLFSELVM